jgi:hypothetical protein
MKPLTPITLWLLAGVLVLPARAGASALTFDDRKPAKLPNQANAPNQAKATAAQQNPGNPEELTQLKPSARLPRHRMQRA